MPGPLCSLKILDFTTLLPGPYATMMLADMGADVIRIEAPNRMDLVRTMPPFDDDVSASHSYLNRSKKSLSLDLKKPESTEIIKSLIEEYDIIIEQFRPGVMQRLSLGYEDLNKINPKLIYCSITGYGQTGPYKDRAGHDINYLSLAGISNYSRRQNSEPTPLGIQVADVAGGSHHAVMGILAAVIHRQQTEEGQAIDISMTDAAFAMNAMSGAGFLAGNIEPEPEEQWLNGGTFYDYYETKDKRYFSVGSLEPKFFMELCKVLKIEISLNESFLSEANLQKNLKSQIKNKFKEKTFQDWCEIFSKLDACVEPVLTFSESCQHPQIQARNMVVEVKKQNGKTQQQLGFPIKFSQSTVEYKHTGKMLGEDNQAILLQLKSR